MYEQIERIAKALERIADKLEGQSPLLADATPKAKKEEAADPLREAVITELTAMKCMPAGRQSTKYLTMLLEKKKAEALADATPAAPKAEPVAEPVEEKSEINMSEMKAQAEAPAAPAAKPAETAKPELKNGAPLELAREKLKVFAKTKGTDAALKMLAKYGVAKISELDEPKLVKLIAEMAV